jgi:hypothetical protein
MGVKLKIWKLIKYLKMDCQIGQSIMKFVINLKYSKWGHWFFLKINYFMWVLLCHKVSR